MKTPEQILKEIEALMKEYNSLAGLQKLNDSDWNIQGPYYATKTFPDMDLLADVYMETSGYRYDIFDIKNTDDPTNEDFVFGSKSFEKLEDCVAHLEEVVSLVTRKKYVGTICVEKVCVNDDDDAVVRRLESDYKGATWIVA